MTPNQTVSDEAPTASAGGETPLSALSNQAVPSEIASTTVVPASDPVLWEQFQKYMRLQNNSQTASVLGAEKPFETALVMKVDWEKVDDIEPETFLIMMWRIREEVLGSNWSRASQLSYLKRHFNGRLAVKVRTLAGKFSERNPVWDFDAFLKYFEKHFTSLSFGLQALRKFKSLNQGSESLDDHNERFNCLMRHRLRRDEGFKSATQTMLEWYIDSLNPKIQDRILLDTDLKSIKSLDELQEVLLEKFPGSLLVRSEDLVDQPLSGSVNEIQTENKMKSRSGKKLKQSKKRSAQADTQNHSKKKKKKLCFTCGKPWDPTHKCSEKKTLEKESNGDIFLIDSELVSGIVHKAFRVPVTIQVKDASRTESVLIDSGSSVNILHESTARSLGFLDKDFQMLKKPTNFLAVNGAGINCIAFVTFKVWFDDLTYVKVGCFVSPSIKPGIILGLPFIQKNAKIIDFENLTVGGAITDKDFEEAEISVCSVEVSGELDQPPLKELTKLLEEYKDIFAEKLGPDQAVATRGQDDVRLQPLGPHLPPVSYTPKVKIGEVDEIKSHIKRMLEAGLIEPSSSGYSSPFLVVRKKTGEIRLVVDYRKINQLLKRYNHAIPTYDHLLQVFAEAKVFSAVDLTEGFHQVPLTKDSRELTAFEFQGIKYQYTRLPFGLTSAPMHLQAFLAKKLQDIPGVVNYIDDIVIASKSAEDHLVKLTEFFALCRRERLFLKRSKCKFMCSAVTFLGYKVSTKGVEIPSNTTEVIARMKIPTTRKELQRFLGFCNYFRSFVKGFARLGRPLYEFLKDGHKWDPECVKENAERLRLALLRAERLTVPLSRRPDTVFVIEADASGEAIGGLLKQVQNNGEGKEQLVACYSRTLSKHEVNYPIRDKELLAIIFTLDRAEHIVGGHQIKVRLDHKSLSTLLTGSREPENGRVLRWIERLSEFDIRIGYVKGETNEAADFLSRQIAAIEPIMVPSEVDMDEVKEEVKKDKYFKDVLSYLTDPSYQKKRRFALIYEHYRLEDGVLYGRTQHTAFRLCVPTSIATRLVKEEHERQHLGITVMMLLIGKKYFIRRLGKIVERVMGACDICLRARIRHRAVYPIQAVAPPSHAFERVSIDLVSGIPEVVIGKITYDTILTVIDDFTKFTIFVPCAKNITTLGVAQILVSKVFAQFGFPVFVRLDRDIRWCNGVVAQISKMLGYKYKLTAANNPRGNGSAEAANKKLILQLSQLLSQFAGDHPEEWLNYLDMAQYFVNSTVHLAIEITPFQALFGREPFIPPNSLREVYAPQITEWGEKLKAVQARVEASLSERQERMELDTNGRSTVFDEFRVGDWVLVVREAYYNCTRYKKLTDVYYGPFRVVKVRGPMTYEVDLPVTSLKARTINGRFLRPYLSENPLFVDLPRTDAEAKFRAKEIKSVVGVDYDNHTIDVTFVRGRPGHCYPIRAADFDQWISKEKKKKLFEEYNKNKEELRRKAERLVPERHRELGQIGYIGYIGLESLEH